MPGSLGKWELSGHSWAEVMSNADTRPLRNSRPSALTHESAPLRPVACFSLS